jgi:predicted small lipoprotein YifL
MDSKRIISIAMVIAALLALSACGRDEEGLEPAPVNTSPYVFTDNFAPNVDYQAFLDSKYDALSMDTEVKYNGTTSLKVIVPGPDDPTGWYAGGAFVDAIGRDLSGYDALTFYARCSKASATINESGLGNDNTGTSIYTATAFGIPITNSWEKYIIPIPEPSKLTLEKGLFFFSEGYEDSEGYTIWFDDIQFEKTGEVSDPRPELAVGEFSAFLGTSVPIPGTSVTFDVGGSDMLISAMPAYFTFFSSDEDVAKVVNGRIQSLSTGTATITAALGGVAAAGEIDFTALAAPVVPADPPTRPSADVISLYSDVYADWPVDSYSPTWDAADTATFTIGDDNILLYTNVYYAAIVFETHVIDASLMEYVHIDLWVPEDVTVVGIKLIDYGEDGTFGGAPDSEKEIFLTTSSTPGITPGSWSSVDIPFTDFTVPGGLASREHLAQFYITGAGITVFADNIYFYKVTTTQ